MALGLIIGGAVGNAIDRLHWPGVMDFVLFHFETADFSFRWYVFNLADLAIVAGVAGLLYESLRRGAPQKRPDRGRNREACFGVPVPRVRTCNRIEVAAG